MPDPAGRFTASHRGGEGPPLVLLHGFTDTWRSWELVLPRLEPHHEVHALTLPGHAGGPRIPDPVSAEAALDLLEAALDAEGQERAHLAGNSLGGFLALKLAGRGRALTVTALAPAGGWADPREGNKPMRLLGGLVRATRRAAPHADALLASVEGRRNATKLSTVNFEHIPQALLVHQLLGVAAMPQSEQLIEAAVRDGWPLDTAAIDVPVQVVWGTEDQLLPWPSAAARYRAALDAEWVVLDGVGHCPQLDIPLETAELILGHARTV